MDNISLTKTDNRWAIIGFILLLPAFLLLSGGLLFSMGQPALNDLYDRYNLLDTLMHPAVILAGMVAAIGVNFFRVFKFNLRREPGSLVSTITMQAKLLNLILIGAVALVGGSIFLYLVVENLF